MTKWRRDAGPASAKGSPSGEAPWENGGGTLENDAQNQNAKEARRGSQERKPREEARRGSHEARRGKPGGGNNQ